MLVLNTSAVKLPLYFVWPLNCLCCSAVEFLSSLCNRHSPSPVLSLWHTVLGDKTRQLLLGMHVGVAVGHDCVCTGICAGGLSASLAILLEV
uniref:Secreted protein n=1 Tax=Cebus imitator TaxID=2715852 RepID=A0A2K5RQB9_CEBIM